jgi:hypothetical protein
MTPDERKARVVELHKRLADAGVFDGQGLGKALSR